MIIGSDEYVRRVTYWRRFQRSAPLVYSRVNHDKNIMKSTKVLITLNFTLAAVSISETCVIQYFSDYVETVMKDWHFKGVQ